MIHSIPSGTRDVLPEETREVRAITDTLLRVFERHGYGEVYTPALEYESVLARADMAEAGWSPSVRLFEAAACGVPIVSDPWPGLDDFFTPGKEILVARTSEQVLEYMRESDAGYLQQLAARARARVLTHHTAAHRAWELEGYLREVVGLNTDEQRATEKVAQKAHMECGA